MQQESSYRFPNMHKHNSFLNISLYIKNNLMEYSDANTSHITTLHLYIYVKYHLKIEIHINKQKWSHAQSVFRGRPQSLNTITIVSTKIFIFFMRNSLVIHFSI